MSHLDTGSPAYTAIRHNSTALAVVFAWSHETVWSDSSSKTFLESPLFCGKLRSERVRRSRWAPRCETPESRLPRELGIVRSGRRAQTCASHWRIKGSPESRPGSPSLSFTSLLLSCAPFVLNLFSSCLSCTCALKESISRRAPGFYSIGLLINTLKFLFGNVGPQIPPATFCMQDFHFFTDKTCWKIHLFILFFFTAA